MRQLPQLKFQTAVRTGDARSAAAAAVEALEPAVKGAMANIERASAGQGTALFISAQNYNHETPLSCYGGLAAKVSSRLDTSALLQEKVHRICGLMQPCL